MRLLQRNYRGRFGEIDLIMQDGKVLVFVEVRARASQRFGGALASIDGHKRDKLTRTAQQYLATLQPVPPCRFDALLFEGGRIEWLRNIFD